MCLGMRGSREGGWVVVVQVNEGFPSSSYFFITLARSHWLIPRS